VPKTKKKKRAEPVIACSDSLSKFFDEVEKREVDDYKEHFHRIAPKEPMAVFRRFLFAYASVHTTWEYNVKLYRQLETLETVPCKEALREVVINSGAGLHRNRIEGVWSFRESYWNDPRVFIKGTKESWVDFRNRLVKHMFALGYAKVSFALELAWPIESKVVCLDVHMLRNLGLSPSPTPRRYLEAEELFVKRCRAKKIPPAIGRLLYWDKLKEQPSARYWSDCIQPVAEEYAPQQPQGVLV
jgi:thermostable 8-oxoguanine DNA glycosylase